MGPAPLETIPSERNPNRVGVPSSHIESGFQRQHPLIDRRPSLLSVPEYISYRATAHPLHALARVPWRPRCRRKSCQRQQRRGGPDGIARGLEECGASFEAPFRDASQDAAFFLLPSILYPNALRSDAAQPRRVPKHASHPMQRLRAQPWSGPQQTVRPRVPCSPCFIRSRSGFAYSHSLLSHPLRGARCREGIIGLWQ
jgi:hypothetical protein